MSLLRNSKLGTKRLQELQTRVPEASILFRCMPDAYVRSAIEAGRLVYLAKIKGEVLQWQHAAKLIKESFDEEYGTTWHCIVGNSYGAQCSFEQDKIIHFAVGPMRVLLFKHG